MRAAYKLLARFLDERLAELLKRTCRSPPQSFGRSTRNGCSASNISAACFGRCGTSLRGLPQLGQRRVLSATCYVLA
ncbi:hypothetical protein D7U74_14030 [Stenotrophomonas maltophilia]|nr:hypothetical protein [Stenotrophomonas maltophilia]